MRAVNQVEAAIKSRRTSKVLLSVDHQKEHQASWTQEHREMLQAMLQAASWAPFHKRADDQYLTGETDAPMPWRFHVLDGDACSRLLTFLQEQAEDELSASGSAEQSVTESASGPECKWSRAWQSKIKEMVAACGTLIQATWLPDPVDLTAQPASDATPVFTQKNIEHVAAAGSAVQSLLVAAESYQWLSYWSSGGILRDEAVFRFLGIDVREQLIGSVFLTPGAHPASRILDGGLREQRGELEGWVRWV